MQIWTLFLTVLALIVLPVTGLFAQSDVPESDKFVVALDLQLDKLRASPLYEKADLKGILKQVQQNLNMDELELEKLDRLEGGCSAPESIGVFEGMEDGSDMPINFFLRATFTEESSAQQLYDSFARKSKEVEVDGKTYLRPKRDAEPQNISISKLNATTLQVGTDAFIMHQELNFHTDKLKATLDSMPDHALRLAIDLDGAEPVVTEGVEIAKQQIPPAMHMFIDLVTKMSTFQIAVDIDADPLVAAAVNAKNADDVEQLKNGIDGILGMAQFGGKQAVSELSKLDPKLGTVVAEMMASLKTVREGNRISLNMPRPNGFEDAVIAGMEKAKSSAQQQQGTNKMKQLALSVHNYYDTYRQLPWEPVSGSDNVAEHSWRVRVLPFLEENLIYEELDLTKPYNEAPNKEFAESMPVVFGSDGKNSNVFLVAPEKLPKEFFDIKDGMSNTIMLIESSEGAPWMQPKNLTIDEAVKMISELPDGQSINAAMYDGAVRKLTNGVPADTLRALFTPKGGEVIADF